MSLADYPKTYLKGIALSLSNSEIDINVPLAEVFLKTIPNIVTGTPQGSLIHLLGNHLYTVWSNTPTPYHGALIFKAIEKLAFTIKENKSKLANWKILYSGIVFMYLLKEKPEPYISYKLAKLITDDVSDIFFREEGDGTRAWTVMLNLSTRVSISIVTLDKSHETNIACFALALFIKAFENEMNVEILAGGTQITEVTINVGRYDMFPQTFKESVSKIANIEEVLESQSCSITRPTEFTENTPTIIFLSHDFFDEFAFGEGKGGSLQTLFGLTLVELAYQLLRGEVDSEILRPKIVSLVRKTIH